MIRAHMRNEVLYEAPARVGLLADVTEALHSSGVNVLAMGACDRGDMGEFLLITDNNTAALKALQELGGEVDLAPVVIVEVANEPGAFARIARRLAEHEINVSQVHATTRADAPTATIVLRSTSELDIVRLLEEE